MLGDIADYAYEADPPVWSPSGLSVALPYSKSLRTRLGFSSAKGRCIHDKSSLSLCELALFMAMHRWRPTTQHPMPIPWAILVWGRKALKSGVYGRGRADRLWHDLGVDERGMVRI